ncbi:MAG TPA: hypothetical protein VFK85_00330 [Anaeromyxobacteraceae bacterium]|nr:hypothetical protein [Anaeromyxobacteraceae bacterium]
MTAVECTHCRVLMTSRSAPGSPVRYWQCPFCARTYASQYGEVFTRGAGARQIEKPPPREEVSGAPQATREEIRWTQLKMRAARWFARLEQEGARAAPQVERSQAKTPVPVAAAARSVP